MRSHNVKNTSIFQELKQEIVYQIYEYLDWLWDTSAFIPCPINGVANKFATTPTHIMYVVLAWRESRMRKQIYDVPPRFR